MTKRIPYDLIAPLAEKYCDAIIQAFETNNYEGAEHNWTLYYSLLKETGWDTKTFDAEMLKRIDQDWEEIWQKQRELPKIPNTIN
jgi:hypothetical protein